MMQFVKGWVLALCLVFVSATSALADAKSDVTAAYAAWDAAFNKGDAKAVASAYLANAKLLPPTHEVMTGPSEIEKFFAGLFANGVTEHKLVLIEAGGDEKIVYATANWSAEGKAKDGAAQSIGGIATHIFERQGDNSLKLRLHTFN
jgi:ketosteroid isomerase-like protein